MGNLRLAAEDGRAGALVVDDDDRFRSFVATILTRAGFAVREAASGEDALASIQADRPALALLDVSLPGINGFEICREIRDQFGDTVPIIFVSGVKSDPLDRSAGLLIGGDDYLVKPIDPNELLARVRRLLARSQHKRNAFESSDLGLTKRELQVLQRMADGLKHIEIAADLVVSPKTVASHVQHILRKLGVHSRTEAVAFAYNSGLLERQGPQVH
jgi:DNA-binding NarL/FixJ family response regulator